MTSFNKFYLLRNGTLFALLVILVFSRWNQHKFQAVYLRIHAQQLLSPVFDKVITKKPSIYACCVLSPLLGEENREQIQTATLMLEEAVSYTPYDPLTNLLLARVYTLSGKYTDAINFYKNYMRLRPENAASSFELGMVYEMLCTEGQGDFSFENLMTVCYDPSLNVAIADAWHAGQLQSWQFVNVGDRSFAQKDFAGAARFYKRSTLLTDDTSGSVLFRVGIAEILSRPVEPGNLPDIFPIYDLTGNIQVDGKNLLWMKRDTTYNLDYGDPFSKYSTPERKAGTFWWEGTGILIINVQNPGLYNLTVNARHNVPVAGQLAVEKDFIPLTQFDVGDSWESYSADLTLSRGLHIIGIKYVKNVGDMWVNWVRIEKQTK